jgi:apolipoprotein N-acyltransferase
MHFQIARMRAMEAQRYMIRAANDGISAVIGRAAKSSPSAGIRAAYCVRGDAAHGPAAVCSRRQLAVISLATVAVLGVRLASGRVG